MRFKKGRRRSRCFPLTSGYYSEIRAFEIPTKLFENIDEKQPILAVVEFGDRAAAQVFAELLERALTFRDFHRKHRFFLFT